MIWQKEDNIKHQKYKDFGNVGEGRLFLNKELLPRYANKFKDGSDILFVGVHKYWDYACYFNNPGKLCNYQTLDYQLANERIEQPAPDIHANIESCDQIQDKSFDGIIMIGVYESLHNKPQTFANINRLLKDGGTALISIPGKGYTPYQEVDENSIYPHDAWKTVFPLIPTEIYMNFENNKVSAVHIICKKGVSGNDNNMP